MRKGTIVAELSRAEASEQVIMRCATAGG
jgi:hypothetical protein